MKAWLLVFVLLLAACGASGDHSGRTVPGSTTPPSATPPGSPSASATTRIRPALVRSACRRLEEFIDAWSRYGYPVAAHRYIAPAQQPPSDQGDFPLLARGSVDRCTLLSAESEDRFTLEVDLTLHFRANRGAWDKGPNSRFVTATRASGASPFRLEFATSP